MPLSFLVLMLGGASFATAFAFILFVRHFRARHHHPRRRSAGAVRTQGLRRVLGILATPYLVLAALSPAAFALIVERWGYGVGEANHVCFGLLSFIGMEIMTIWYRRRESRTAATA